MVAQAVATIALGLLGASGVAKLIDPEPTTGAMDAARLPSSNILSRLLGVIEMVVAVAALAVGGWPALLAATGLYLAFAVFTFSALLNRIPVQSCGCFGRDDTPPTSIHVAYNVVSAITIGMLVAGPAPIDWTMGTIELALYLVVASIGVYASYLLLTRLPQLLELTRPT